MIKAIIIAMLAGILVLAGIYVALDRLHPFQADNPAHNADGNGTEAGGGDFTRSFISAFRASCTTSAREALAQRGIDTSSKDMTAKIDTYCNCASDRAGSDLSLREILAFKLNPSSEPAASKMKGIIKDCGAKMMNTGQ
jgi:hypothetical protein